MLVRNLDFLSIPKEFFKVEIDIHDNKSIVLVYIEHKGYSLVLKDDGDINSVFLLKTDILPNNVNDHSDREDFINVIKMLLNKIYSGNKFNLVLAEITAYLLIASRAAALKPKDELCPACPGRMEHLQKMVRLLCPSLEEAPANRYKGQLVLAPTISARESSWPKKSAFAFPPVPPDICTSAAPAPHLYISSLSGIRKLSKCYRFRPVGCNV